MDNHLPVEYGGRRFGGISISSGDTSISDIVGKVKSFVASLPGFVDTGDLESCISDFYAANLDEEGMRDAYSDICKAMDEIVPKGHYFGRRPLNTNGHPDVGIWEADDEGELLLCPQCDGENVHCYDMGGRGKQYRCATCGRIRFMEEILKGL